MTAVTQGQIIHQREAGACRMTETRHAPNCALPKHEHDRPALTLVLEGSFAELCNARQWICSTLALFYKPAGLVHANRYGPRGARSFIIEFQADPFDASMPETPQDPGDSTDVLVPLALASREAMLHPGTIRLATDELMRELCSRAAERTCPERAGRPAWLERVEEQLRSSVEAPPGLDALSREAGVHPVHVSRAFRRHHGVTLSRFVSRRRVARAVRRLAAGAPIAATALELGYYDQSHFTTAFRRETGVTPAAWQRLAARASLSPPG